MLKLSHYMSRMHKREVPDPSARRGWAMSTTNRWLSLGETDLIITSVV